MPAQFQEFPKPSNVDAQTYAQDVANARAAFGVMTDTLNAHNGLEGNIGVSEQYWVKKNEYRAYLSKYGA